MANQERIYKDLLKTDNPNPDTTFIKVDSNDFKRPMAISATGLGKILNLRLDADLDSKNVSGLQFKGQDQDPRMNPEQIPIDNKVFIAIDENFLYIWVSIVKKWKRIPLGDWPDADLPPPE